jgi:hypothetical protein
MSSRQLGREGAVEPPPLDTDFGLLSLGVEEEPDPDGALPPPDPMPCCKSGAEPLDPPPPPPLLGGGDGDTVGVTGAIGALFCRCSFAAALLAAAAAAAAAAASRSRFRCAALLASAAARFCAATRALWIVAGAPIAFETRAEASEAPFVAPELVIDPAAITARIATNGNARLPQIHRSPSETRGRRGRSRGALRVVFC